MKNLFDLSSYQYPFDESLIAKHPVQPRDTSRLMRIDRSTGEISEMVFHEIIEEFNAGDTFVFNDTKVIPPRLIGQRSGGGQAEIFLIKALNQSTWTVMAKPGKKIKEGSLIFFASDFQCKILETHSDGTKIVEFICAGAVDFFLEKYGQIPLPHYMGRVPEERDKVDYQTVYAKVPGALAAPTAGLHFTDQLLEKMAKKNIGLEKVTLHVGLGTFKPVMVDDVRSHKMHEEQCFISEETARVLNFRNPTTRQICVGTTCCRTLESAALADGTLVPGQYQTDIFIYPGYQFKHVRGLLTNFHLPGSTLLMLVSAFAGYDLTMEAYAKAVKERYRFFSYGDAMLIV